MEHYLLISSNTYGPYRDTNTPYKYTVELPKTLHLDHKKWKVALVDAINVNKASLIVSSNICQTTYVLGQERNFLRLLKEKDVISPYYVPIRTDSIKHISIVFRELNDSLAYDLLPNTLLLHLKSLPF